MGRGIPMEGPGSCQEPYILRGIDMKCPKCGGTEDLWRNEHMLRMVGITPLKEGGWDLDNVSRDEALWETSTRNPEEPEFTCRACDSYFNAPDIEELDGSADHVRSKEDAQIHQGA